MEGKITLHHDVEKVEQKQHERPCMLFGQEMEDSKLVSTCSFCNQRFHTECLPKDQGEDIVCSDVCRDVFDIEQKTNWRRGDARSTRASKWGKWPKKCSKWPRKSRSGVWKWCRFGRKWGKCLICRFKCKLKQRPVWRIHPVGVFPMCSKLGVWEQSIILIWLFVWRMFNLDLLIYPRCTDFIVNLCLFHIHHINMMSTRSRPLFWPVSISTLHSIGSIRAIGRSNKIICLLKFSLWTSFFPTPRGAPRKKGPVYI